MIVKIGIYYYLFMNKSPYSEPDSGGPMIYRSTDLKNWRPWPNVFRLHKSGSDEMVDIKHGADSVQTAVVVNGTTYLYYDVTDDTSLAWAIIKLATFAEDGIANY
jgi:hypothetical protein